VTVVFSPRGGAGATTLATNLAVALAQRSPERAVLVDLDVVFSHAAMLLNLMPRTSLAAISTYALRQMDRESLDSYLMVHRASSLRVLTGALRPEEAELVTAEHVRIVVDLLRNYFAHVVIDTGRNFSEVNLAAFEMADEILLVCTPDRVGAHAALEARRVLFDLVHLPRERVRAVLNRTTPYRGQASGHFESEVPFGGEAPLRAALEGQPVVIGWPGSPVSRAVGQLADEVETRAREALALAQR
jgi:pilus assembly protein CpaE